MSPPTRRALLATLGVGVAGCLSTGRPDTTGGGDDTDDTDAARAPATDVPATHEVTAATSGSVTGTDSVRLELRPTPLDGDPALVYPPALAEGFREAATTDRVVRGFGTAFHQAPTPPLDGAAPLHLEGPDVDGTYDGTVDLGIRVTLKFVADRVESAPADATVHEFSRLSSAKRTLVRPALDGDVGEVSPEKPLARWVREALWDAYVRREGVLYRVTRHRGTDTAFFEDRVYYVLDLTSTEQSTTTSLSLRRIPAPARRVLNETFRERRREAAVTSVVEEPPPALRELAAETSRLVTYEGTFALSLDDT